LVSGFLRRRLSVCKIGVTGSELIASGLYFVMKSYFLLFLFLTGCSGAVQPEQAAQPEPPLLPQETSNTQTDPARDVIAQAAVLLKKYCLIENLSANRVRALARANNLIELHSMEYEALLWGVLKHDISAWVLHVDTSEYVLVSSEGGLADGGERRRFFDGENVRAKPVGEGASNPFKKGSLGATRCEIYGTADDFSSARLIIEAEIEWLSSPEITYRTTEAVGKGRQTGMFWPGLIWLSNKDGIGSKVEVSMGYSTKRSSETILPNFRISTGRALYEVPD